MLPSHTIIPPRWSDLAILIPIIPLKQSVSASNKQGILPTFNNRSQFQLKAEEREVGGK